MIDNQSLKFENIKSRCKHSGTNHYKLPFMYLISFDPNQACLLRLFTGSFGWYNYGIVLFTGVGNRGQALYPNCNAGAKEETRVKMQSY